MSIKTISAGIKTVLTPLVTQSKVVAIYEYANPKTTGYPYIEIVPTGFENAYFTNQNNQIEYQFEIRIHQEKTEDNRGASNAQDDINQVLDDVLALITAEQFDSTPLAGSCDFIRPSVAITSEEVNELAEIVQTVTLTAVTTI